MDETVNQVLELCSDILAIKKRLPTIEDGPLKNEYELRYSYLIKLLKTYLKDHHDCNVEIDYA